MVQEILNFFKEFRDIRKTIVTKIILAFPLLLIFILLNLIIFIYDEQSGSIVSNDVECAKIGKEMLLEGGSVIDAAIATMFCEGVILPNRAGIGGGFTAILYVDGQMETLTATPIVPRNFPKELSNNRSQIKGAKAGGVPGELLGYWEMHRKYGLLPWRDLLQPTIELCENGVPITEWSELDIQRSAFYLHQSAAMRQLHHTLMESREGKTFKFKTLAKTLRRIANEGPRVFYDGDIGEAFIKDMQADGGFMTMADLRSYNVSWGEAIMSNLPMKRRAYTTGLPSMGATVTMVMNVIKSAVNVDEPIFWHRTIEAMKHAYGLSYNLADIENEADEEIVKQVSETFKKMTDMDFAFNLRTKIKDDRILSHYSDYGVKYQPTVQAGTSNICIISPKGEAIVMSSSLMWDSGAFGYSKKTGIILNTQLRCFFANNTANNGTSFPTSPAQLIRPGKRALSPHAPTIVLERSRAEVFFAVGAAGSALIPSQVITALIEYCLKRANAEEATNSAFFHPNVLTNTVALSDAIVGPNINESVIDYLRKVGHNVTISIKQNPYAIRTCIGHSLVKPAIDFTKTEQGGVAVVQPAHGFNTFLIIVIVCMALWILSWLIYEIVSAENERRAAGKVNDDGDDDDDVSQ